MAKAKRDRKRKQSYSDLKFDTLQQDYRLTLAMNDLFVGVSPVAASDWLITSLSQGRPLIFASEKARSEFLVAPILLFVRSLLENSVTVYSGLSFDVEPEKGLKGVCDFIVGKTPPLPFVRNPLLVIVEAKKNDIEDGIGQCVAQMLAARIFNQRRDRADPVVYGCVTTGESWLFMQLADKTLTFNERRYNIGEVEKILGILHHIFTT